MVIEDLIEIEVTDLRNTWTMPLSRQLWADFIAASVMAGISEPEAIDLALANFVAANGTAPMPSQTTAKPSMPWWHFALLCALLIGTFAFNSLVIGRR